MSNGRLLADLYPDVDFHADLSEWVFDIKFIDKEFGGNRGICIPETKRVVIFLNRHENAEDIMNTMVHEAIHCCISDEEYFGDGEPLIIDIEKEHEIIRQMAWFGENYDENTYYSIINGKNIKPLIKEDEYESLMKKYNKSSDLLDECVEHEICKNCR